MDFVTFGAGLFCQEQPIKHGSHSDSLSLFCDCIPEAAHMSSVPPGNSWVLQTTSLPLVPLVLQNIARHDFNLLAYVVYLLLSLLLDIICRALYFADYNTEVKFGPKKHAREVMFVYVVAGKNLSSLLQYLIARDDPSPECCVYKTFPSSCIKLFLKIFNSCSWWNAVSKYIEI